MHSDIWIHCIKKDKLSWNGFTYGIRFTSLLTYAKSAVLHNTYPVYYHVVLQMLDGLVAAAPDPLAWPSPCARHPSLS